MDVGGYNNVNNVNNIFVQSICVYVFIPQKKKRQIPYNNTFVQSFCLHVFVPKKRTKNNRQQHIYIIFMSDCIVYKQSCNNLDIYANAFLHPTSIVFHLSFDV